MLDKLRKIAESATPGPWRLEVDGDEVIDYAVMNGSVGMSEHAIATSCSVYSRRAGHDVRHIATFDPPTVLALLDVAEAAVDIASDDYLDQPGPYATGICREEAVVLTEAVARLRTLAGEGQT